jgi:hypothetical protein
LWYLAAASRQPCQLPNPNMKNPLSQTISIVVPAVGSVKNSNLLESYDNAQFQCYQVQFVFMVNSREPSRDRKCESTKLGRHEILSIYNDRYFGSCEENISRVGDFIDLLGDLIVIVGEHDSIDWEELGKAAGIFFEKSLDAMAINIKGMQRKADGSYAVSEAIVPININISAYDYAQVLLSGQVLGSEIAFPALISCFGPIDWAAFIGSHFLKKEVLKRILMLKHSEDVYSIVYKQLRIFSSVSCRYSLYPGTPVHRISSEYLHMAQGRHSWGWLEDHRTVKGLSPCFWIANLQHLVEIQNPFLFVLATYSHCLSSVPNAEGGISRNYHSFFRIVLQWSADVLNHKLSGRSHYLPDASFSCDLGDLYTVYAYLEKLTTIIASDAELAKLLGTPTLAKLENATRYLDCYLKSMSDSNQLISKAIREIDAVRSGIDSQRLVQLCDASYGRYLRSLGMKKGLSPRLGACSSLRVLSRSLARRYAYSGFIGNSVFLVKCRIKPVLKRLGRAVRGSALIPNL